MDSLLAKRFGQCSKADMSQPVPRYPLHRLPTPFRRFPSALPLNA